MAVTSFRRHSSRASGAIGKGGSPKLTARWRVTTAEADPIGVLEDYLSGNPSAPWPGRFYQFDGETFWNVYCQEVSIEPVEKVPGSWIVTATYGPQEEDEQKPDKDGNPSTNPLEWDDTIETQQVAVMRAVTEAYHEGGFQGDALARWPLGKKMIPANSAGVVNDPPLEVERYQTLLRVNRHRGGYPADIQDQYVGKINSDEFTIDKPQYLFRLVVGKYCSLLLPLQCSFEITNSTSYWKYSLELLIDRDTHIVPVPDMGTSAVAQHGDPDGFGGTVDGDKIPLGVPPLRRLKDAMGNNLTEPVPLNGSGQPLAVGADHVNIKWRKHEAVPFAPLDI